MHCAPVIGQPALRDKALVTLGTREGAVTSMQLHVVSEGLGSPGKGFAADRALQRSTFAMLTKVCPQKLAPMCGVSAVGLRTGKGGEVRRWMFVLYVKDESNIRGELLQALAAPEHRQSRVVDPHVTLETSSTGNSQIAHFTNVSPV